MITHLVNIFKKKSLYLNELARFGQFIKYMLLRSSFSPLLVPFSAAEGPLLVPILKNLGPLSMWEQCSRDTSIVCLYGRIYIVQSCLLVTALPINEFFFLNHVTIE